ncbi:hypothetical protein C8Q74DRAFT_846910 [Fomes fomentarius]|nr:hypothetical protein C8Q74DRAFT_846910 [Fomes fomentarius]
MRGRSELADVFLVSRCKELVKRTKSLFTSDRELNAFGKDLFWRKRLASRNEITVDASERNLVMRLELARRNSQNQNGHEYDSAIEELLEETFYEDESPPSLRLPRTRPWRSQRHCKTTAARALSLSGLLRQRSVRNRLCLAALSGMEGLCLAIILTGPTVVQWFRGVHHPSLSQAHLGHWTTL